MKFFKSAIVTAALTVGALAAAPASAALILGSIPSGSQTNEFIRTFYPGTPNNSVEGYYGSHLFLVGGPALITAEYFGAEAGFTNTFTYGGCTLKHTGGAQGPGLPGTFQDIGPAGLGPEDAQREGQANCLGINQAPGLLTFGYSTNSGAFTFTNATNTDNTGPGANFFVSFDNNYVLDTNINHVTPGGGQSVFLFLDDGGANNDDNHDDLVVRLSIACVQGVNCGFQIPEPGSLALVGLALLGAGAVRRRKSA